ncbi:MAG TPA: hypothetical protein VNX40_04380 [Mucilaginibacter sp.]|jgi:uncharacterized integral membrane protein|nr:hypothetical protein [Mucilaginibacter sp.]
MRIKTIVIILIAVLLTVMIMQNTDEVWFKILFFKIHVSKLSVMLLVAIVAFILGWLVGRPKRVIRLGGDTDGHNPDDDEPGTLSKEDREYIN